MLDRHPALWESSTATTDLDNSLLPSSFSSLARSSSNSDNPKRRSLQNMPYYRSSEEDPITPPRLPRSIDLGAGLSRTQSLPFSDLQALRSRSATGSRRSSVNSPQQALSPTPPARLSRVPSVNPLTVLGLKAACLGVHLKRRRMACCLLALRFQAGVSSDYWQEVKAALNELKEAMVVQRDTLEAARKEAERESSSAMTLDGPTSSGLIPPWPITFGRPVDFAPRTSEQAIMLGHIEKLRSALTKAWADLSTVQASLLDGPDGLAIQWKVLREDLGVMIREWERGKDVVARLTPDDDINHDVPVMNGGVDNGTVPEFLKAWDDEDGVAPSALNGIPGEIQPRLDPPMLEPAIPMSSSEVVEAYSEELPPPGIEQVFEAISVPLRSDKSALSGLSRDERIRLTKEARTKGISLGDLLEGGKDDKGPSQVEKAVRMNGNEVVSELRGMIGMIRKRKGQVEGTREADLSKENEGEDKTGIPKEERESSKSERVEVEGVKTYLGLEISAQKRSQKI